MKKLTQSSFEMCAINFSFIKFVTLPLNGLLFFCWTTLGALATKSKTFSATARMPLILFWAEVEEEEDDDENSVFPALMKMEEEGEEEEESLFSGLMAPDEEGSDLYWEMVSDHRGWAKTSSRPHHQSSEDN